MNRGIRTIGLLGGSFNPAHEGHRHISLEALRRLRLDAVWWLVSPQNPLKPVAGMAPLDQRVGFARRMAAHPRIRVTDIESRLGTRYTADTLACLSARFPRCRFVWLMGADNLAGFHRWSRWRRIADLVPIAVLPRPPYSARVTRAPAALKLAAFRAGQRKAAHLAGLKPPVWMFLPVRQHPASATDLRRNGLSALHGASHDASSETKTEKD
jgi:nicotinate-nucleotide adenylyltransferase